MGTVLCSNFVDTVGGWKCRHWRLILGGGFWVCVYFPLCVFSFFSFLVFAFIVNVLLQRAIRSQVLPFLSFLAFNFRIKMKERDEINFWHYCIGHSSFTVIWTHFPTCFNQAAYHQLLLPWVFYIFALKGLANLWKKSIWMFFLPVINEGTKCLIKQQLFNSWLLGLNNKLLVTQ